MQQLFVFLSVCGLFYFFKRFKPCAWTSVKRSHTGGHHSCWPPVGCRRGCRSCAYCPCRCWTGIGVLQMLQQRRKSTVGHPEASLGWQPGAVKPGSCIRTGCRDCEGKKRCMCSAARDDGSQRTYGRRTGMSRMKLMTQRRSSPLPA